MMAEVLSISPRALKQWEDRDGRERRRQGRPEVISAEARERIRECYAAHYKQWGPRVLADWCRREGLGNWSASTVGRVIADLVDRRTKPEARRRYEITASDVMWSEDGTSFGRGRRKRELLVIQDEHARKKLQTRLVRGSASEANAVTNLRAAFEEHGAPLVLKHDGASVFHGAEMRRLLDEYGVLDLTSPPYWPGYNGKQERSMRDIHSMELAIRRHGVKGSLRQRLDLALHDLNDERPRPMLGGLTASEVYARDAVDEVDRTKLAEEVRQETRRLRAQARSWHERRASRRRAVEMVLSRHGFLVEIGGSVN